MIQLTKKIILRLFLLFLLIVGVSMAAYVYDLKTRFPDLDLSRSRVGIASWYSETDDHINEHTANGEKFDEDAMTCATWDYPFGEKLLVINTLNGKWVVCRVNDRGPGKRLRREIDLTKAAFKKISHLKKGLIYVTIIPTAKKR
jgi:rare lipoprotein A